MFTNRVPPKKAHITSVPPKGQKLENHFEALERVYPEGQKLSTSWHFLANIGIFVLPAIKKELPNMENGC